MWYNSAKVDTKVATKPRLVESNSYMDAHAHISAVHLLAGVAATVAVFGTLHLLALTTDNRASRAFIALGF